LGEYVHRDYPCQAFHNAGLILMGLKAPVNPGNPYLASANQGGFVTFGLADMLSRVSEISRIALKAAWFQKWRLHRRLRPEAYAGRVHQMLNNQASYPLHRDVLQSPILQAIHNQTGSHLLPLAYPEGAPTHPAYPSGHATIAGACITVLKAFFDPNFVLPAPVVVDPASNGTALKPLAATLTVEGELNKLAGNLSIGRNLAGVHWRSDAQEGLMLGQAVALSVLQDWKLTYNESPSPIRFRGFNGELITV
jgi:membrane-associated phospholipid phosphatase